MVVIKQRHRFQSTWLLICNMIDWTEASREKDAATTQDETGSQPSTPRRTHPGQVFSGHSLRDQCPSPLLWMALTSWSHGCYAMHRSRRVPRHTCLQLRCFQAGIQRCNAACATAPGCPGQDVIPAGCRGAKPRQLSMGRWVSGSLKRTRSQSNRATEPCTNLKNRAIMAEATCGSVCSACAADVMAHTTMPSMPCGPIKDCMLRVKRNGTVSWPRSSWKRVSYVVMRSACVMVPMLRDISSLLGERPVRSKMWQAAAAPGIQQVTAQ